MLVSGRLTTIIRLDLRLERWRLAAWVVGLSVMPAIVYRSYTSLFSTSAQRSGLSKAFGSSTSLTVIAGPEHDLSTVGGLTAWKCLVFCATLAGVMSITTVIRRTRADEEAGRTELLGSTPLSPAATLTAGVLVGLCASVLTATLMAIGLIAVGSPLLGALSLSGAVAASGIAFVAIAAVAAQVTTTARAASALGFAALGVAFILRAVGDSTSLQWLDWCTPLGWAELVSPFDGDRLWILGLSGLCFLAGSLAAAWLLSSRDIGSGLLEERRGLATARPTLSGALGLAWRLDARWILVWVIALVAFGMVIGSVTQALADLAAGNHLFNRFLGGDHGSLTDLYLGQMLEMLSVLAAAGGIQAVLRARTEEEAGRTEELLATGMTRVRFLGSHLVMGATGAAVALLCAGLGMAASASISGTSIPLLGVIAGIGVQLVPCLALVASSAALVGCAPRLSVLALPLVIATYVLTSFGDVLGLPRWILGASVYAHIPRVPGGSAASPALLVVGALAIALAAVGLIGMRRRDLT